MAVYLSDIKTISSSKEVVFNVLSNLESLAKIQASENLNEYFRLVNISTNSCTLEINKLGRVGLNVIEKTPYHSIKFSSFDSPVHLDAEIKLNKISDESTAIQFVIDADMPKMLQMMFDKKLRKGVNVFADIFEQVLNKHI